jgi:ribosomal protein S18 acetylase RimI-like enzyme
MDDTLFIRISSVDDAEEAARMIKQLAAQEGEESAVDAAYVREFLSFPGCGILMAKRDGKSLGLLSYSIRPNLYHARESCLIEEFVVDEKARGQGIGTMLIKMVMELANGKGCAEISVSTMPDNANAIRFYRSRGFEDEAVYLERHF